MAVKRFAVAGLVLLLAAPLATHHAWAAEPIEGSNAPSNRIIARARADLTPAGAAWAKEEAQRVLSGQVQPFEVAKNAASVKDGVVTGASVDELVLITLIEAQNAHGGTVGAVAASPEPPAAGERATRSATLEQSIANLLHSLADTQHAGPQEKM